MSKDARRSLAALTLLLATIWCLPAPPLQSQDRPAADSKDSAILQRLREAGDRMLDGVRRQLDRPEYKVHDVFARAQLLGFDPARIIEFVRKDVAFEPYPGLQRGPSGVLVSGSGNGVDKAFLLRELLIVSGFEARMVQGSLERDKAEELVKTWLVALRKRSPNRFGGAFGRGASDQKKFEEACRDGGMASEEWARLIRAEDQSRRESWEDVLALTSRELEDLQSRIRASAVEGRERPILEELIAATRSHAWVQWKAKDAAAWTDTDPSRPDLTGATLQGEVDPRQAADQLSITIALERTTGGKREEVVVVARDVPAYEALLKPVGIMILPPDAVVAGAEKQTTEADLIKNLQSYREFLAIIRVGDDLPSIMVFDYEGRVSKPLVAAGKLAATAAAAAQKAADLFAPPKAAEVKGVLENLRIDLKMIRGGKALWTQRRTVLEEGKRAVWCPMLAWNMFLPSSEVSRRFVATMDLRNRVWNDSRIKAIQSWSQNGVKADLTKAIETPGYDYPADLLGYCLARQGFLSSTAGASEWMYFERPGLVMSVRQVRIHEGQSNACYCYGMDVVDNGAIILGSGDRVAVDRARTTALGVFDTVLEQAWVRDRNPSETLAGTVAFFERARSLGRAVRVVGARDAKGLAEAGVPRSDVEWILANTGEDRLIVAAALEASHCAGVYAWWELDPVTGRALGRISGGRGGATPRICARVTTGEEAALLHLHVASGTLCALAALGLVIGGREGAGTTLLVCAGAMGAGHAGVALGILGFKGGVILIVADMLHTLFEYGTAGSE